ncbi:MAG: holo-ACP synthase [Endomicrobium sp.]|jgi:holo-[acyl-carrier protein] synthase|nr:holo-ACP synthase [Endomicrobium sp.]
MRIGIDIEEVNRFLKYSHNKNYYKFLNRIFTKKEISYSFTKKRVAQHLAARFAAKEAIWKMLNTKNIQLNITDIAIHNEKNGKPKVFIKNKFNNNINLSLSHTKKYVVAVAIML